MIDKASPTHQPLSARVFAGALVGFFGAIALAVVGIIAFAIYALSDPPTVDATVPVGLGLYIMGGAVSGAVGGALFPVARSRVGAALVGTVVAQPFIWACAIIVALSDPMTLAEASVIAVIMTLCFGPIIGLAWIRPLHKF